MLKKIFLLLLFILLLTPFTIPINKAFLKYKRDIAMQYARAHWYHINEKEGYKNYGLEFKDGLLPTTIWPDCTKYGVHSAINDCGGDCANFVSQCLIAGEISEFELTKSVDRNYVAAAQSHETIANAEALGNRLIEMGAIDNTSGRIISSDLQPGDLIVVPQSGSYHALLVNQGSPINDQIQVYGHSPLSQAGVAPKGFLGNWPQAASARLIHIPDVPMVESVKVYKKISNSKIVYYEAHFDPKAGGDGALVLDVNKPIFNFFDDNPLYIEVTFDRPLNINFKKPVVKIINGIVKKSTSFSSGNLTPQVKIDEFKSISLKDVTGGNVSKADQAKVRIFEYDSTNNDLTGENGNWFLKIEDAVSAMDNTPMNGWGDYSLANTKL